MKPGLVSITFRKLTPSQILDLCVGNGLREIEWGGELKIASEVAEMSRSRGVAIAAYGSYYKLGVPEALEFSSVLNTAVALGAPIIRVWAGNKGSAEADSGLRAAVVDDARRCADLAAEKNLKLTLEFHGGTLTDTTDSAVDFLNAVSHPFVTSLWQPPHGFSKEECIHSLRCLMPFIQHIHVFHWWPDFTHRLRLEDGLERWTAYVAELRRAELDLPLLLEFVADDRPEALVEDARTLLRLCD